MFPLAEFYYDASFAGAVGPEVFSSAGAMFSLSAYPYSLAFAPECLSTSLYLNTQPPAQVSSFCLPHPTTTITPTTSLGLLPTPTSCSKVPPSSSTSIASRVSNLSRHRVQPYQCRPVSPSNGYPRQRSVSKHTPGPVRHSLQPYPTLDSNGLNQSKNNKIKVSVADIYMFGERVSSF